MKGEKMTRMTSSICVSLVAGILLLSIMSPKLLCAEPFVDLSVGGNITQSADVNGSRVVRVPQVSSVTVGARLGYWFEAAPVLGVAGTVSYYSPGETMVPFSLLLMARARYLESQEFPNGQLQPYVGVGGGLFVLDTGSHTTSDFGLDVRAGISWLFTPHIGVFSEYRLTEVGTTIRSGDVSLYTHHFLAGATYHF